MVCGLSDTEVLVCGGDIRYESHSREVSILVLNADTFVNRRIKDVTTSFVSTSKPTLVEKDIVVAIVGTKAHGRCLIRFDTNLNKSEIIAEDLRSLCHGSVIDPEQEVETEFGLFFGNEDDY